MLDKDTLSMVRCVKCGRYILDRIKGRYKGEVVCKRCNTRFFIDMDRVDMTIEYDDRYYVELER